MNITILPASEKSVFGGSWDAAGGLRSLAPFGSSLSDHVVLPGEQIEAPEGYMRGHGTYDGDDDKIYSSVCGVVEKVNRLIYVRPIKRRYVGDTGDILVGRVDEIASSRWYIDVGSAQRAQLQLAAITLPGNEQRRRNAADGLDMRNVLAEGELTSTEVQRVQNDGVILLHTRSARYGRLQNGCFIRVPSTLIRRQQQHMVTLPNGVHLVLGNNGQIWISVPPKESHLDTLNYAGIESQAQYEMVDLEKRKEICRVRNCITILSTNFIEISPASIMKLVDRSSREDLQVKDLLRPDIIARFGVEYLHAETSGNMSFAAAPDDEMRLKLDK